MARKKASKLLEKKQLNVLRKLVDSADTENIFAFFELLWDENERLHTKGKQMEKAFFAWMKQCDCPGFYPCHFCIHRHIEHNKTPCSHCNDLSKWQFDERAFNGSKFVTQ